MARLLIHVESQTEESFVNNVLRSHLTAKGYHSGSARFVGNPRQRGGIRKWPAVRKGIMDHLKEDRECISTTMGDYYALPQSGDGGWPGRAAAATLSSAVEKAESVERALLEDLAGEMGDCFNRLRFVPFIVMHEFEGLLFSDCDGFSRSIQRADLQSEFQKIREQFATPEEINDSPDAASSKRIQALAPGYQKPLFGLRAMLEIGLATVRAQCPHFNTWLKTLEWLAR